MVNDTRQVLSELSDRERGVEQLQQMLAELDAVCRQARELSTQIKLQMSEQKHQERQATGIIHFPRPA